MMRVWVKTAGYGWKWENKPNYAWESYFANYIKLNNYDIRLNPFYLLYGGRVSSGFLSNAGSAGGYWSSTAGSSTGTYSLNFNSSNVDPSGYNGRYDGFSIRCLAR